jgi:hypothetical protein
MSSRPSAQPISAPVLERPWNEPWPLRAVMRLVLIGVVVAIALAITWYFCGGTTDLNRQVLWVLIACGVLVVGGLAQSSFLLDAMRSVRRRRLAVMIDVSQLADRRAPAPGSVTVPADPADLADADDRLTAVGMVHFHRPGCPLLVGKPQQLHASSDEHVQAGRQPCGVCAA